ncbi:DEAD-box ATP-dependent RNA helicase 47A [Pycnococcus provasolii]
MAAAVPLRGAFLPRRSTKAPWIQPSARVSSTSRRNTCGVGPVGSLSGKAEVPGGDALDDASTSYPVKAPPDDAFSPALPTTASASWPRNGSVHPSLLLAMDSLRLTEPTDIQQKAIQAILAEDSKSKSANKNNIAIQAHTGSGKTLAYLVPALSRVLKRTDEEGAVPWPLVAVVAPSRELAVQIRRVAVALLGGGNIAKDAVAIAIGGANSKKQTKHIRRTKPLVVVGTPGRLQDLVKSGAFGLHELDAIVFDEADELASAAARERKKRNEEHSEYAKIGALDYLLAHAGRRADGGGQAVFVSATLRLDEAEQLAHLRHTKEAVQLVQGGVVAPRDEMDVEDDGDPPPVFTTTTEQRTMLPPTIKHVFVRAPPTDRARGKAEMLRKLFHALDGSVSLPFLAFVRATGDANNVADALRSRRGIDVDVLTGSEQREARANAVRRMGGGGMAKMAAATSAAAAGSSDADEDGDEQLDDESPVVGGGKSDILVVTDIGARGLDTTLVDVVVHTDVPESSDAYVHRSGRTARMGRRGLVVSFVPEGDEALYRKVVRGAGVSFDEVEEVEVRQGRVWFVGEKAAEAKKKDAKTSTAKQHVQKGKRDDRRNENRSQREQKQQKQQKVSAKSASTTSSAVPTALSAPARQSTFDAWNVPHSVRRHRKTKR